MLILFYASPSLLSRFIRWVTHAKYSHVAIMVNGNLYEALGRGIVVRRGGKAWQRARQAAGWHLVSAHQQDRDRTQTWLEMQAMHGYSWLGFIAAGVGSLTANRARRLQIALDGEYICSGLVATALQIAGRFNPLMDPRLETPASLAEQYTPEPIPGSWPTRVYDANRPPTAPGRPQ